MGDRAALEKELDYVKDLPGFERSNPQFFPHPMIDKLMEVVLMLGGEVWTNRDRQMIMEHLLATEGQVTPDLIETFKPDDAFKERAAAERQKMVGRVFGCLYGDSEAPTQKNHFSWVTRKDKTSDAA